MKRVQFKNSLDIFVRHLQGKVPNEGLYTETLFSVEVKVLTTLL